MQRSPLRVGMLVVAAMLVGALLAPVLLPMLTIQSTPAQAQSVPWTPTPEPPPPTSTLPPTSTPVPVAQAATATPTLTPTPIPPGERADVCEPNDSLVQPCALQTEVDIGDLTFVDDAIDVYSFLLKGQRIYTIRAQAASGIDPVVTIYLAGKTDVPLAQNDDARPGDASAEVQVQTPADGWYLVVVENKAPGSMRGRVYSLSARSSAAPTPVPGVGTGSGGAGASAGAVVGDAYENNYDLDHAGRLLWGVPYDLSLICPDPRPDACPSGDHDFFLIPVKRGIPLVAVTYDLGPGTDTDLMLQRPDPSQTLQGPGVFSGWRPLAGNDDVLPGWTLRSQVEVTPDWSGVALLVVSPSSRENLPRMPEALGPPGRYRLIIGSPALPAVAQVLEAQTDVPPAPTVAPIPTGAAADPAIDPTPVADAREVIRESCATGRAAVRADGTPIYGAAPPTAADKLAEYPADAAVRLLGQCYGGWVKVQPLDSVSPGWMWGPALQPAEIGGGELATAVPTGGAAAGDAAAGDAASATPAPGAGTRAAGGVPRGTPQLEALPLAQLPAAPTAAPVARTLTVEVCGRTSGDARSCTRPMVGLGVEVVVAATQAVQVSGITDAQGLVTLSLSLPPQTAIQVRVAAAGVQVDVPADAARLPIRVPLTREGGAP